MKQNLYWGKVGLRLLTVAATVAILWIAGSFIFGKNRSAERIYATYYQPYPNLLKTIGQHDQSHLAAGMKKYEVGDYSEALIHLEKAIIKDSGNPGLQFYYAICQLEAGNPGFAVADFEYIVQVNDSVFSPPARWYLGLAYLRLNRKEKAQNVFKLIKMNGGAYREKADEILHKL